MHEGSCHCGAVAFTVDAPMTSALACNCSLCRRRGTLLAFVPREAMTVTQGADVLARYTFNRHAIVHRFCTTCGVAPFSEGTHPATGEAMAAINVRCLPGIDLSTLQITEVDGARF